MWITLVTLLLKLQTNFSNTQMNKKNNSIWVITLIKYSLAMYRSYHTVIFIKLSNLTEMFQPTMPVM